MNSVFITGSIAVGKTYLANKLCASLGMKHIKTDDLWETVKDDPALKPWFNYFWNKDETKYYRTTSPERLWQDIVDQSEALWPIAKKHIEQILEENEQAIFEGVSLLPHLMRQIPIQGIVLTATSEQQIFDRLRAEPRWSNIMELQKVEAHAFFTVENRYYELEAKEYGYLSFSDPVVAEAELLRLIQNP